jgi:hypothetical protein
MGNYLNLMIVVTLLFVLLPAAAQKKGYEPGYLITLQGDTLHGQVKDRSGEPFEELYSKIRFREEGKRKKRNYRPDQIRGYMAREAVYTSIPLREESEFFKLRYFLDPNADYIFLQVVRRDGPLTWYRREFVHDDNSFLDSYPLFHKEGSPELVRVTQGVFGLKRKLLAGYLRDCPALVRALDTREVNKTLEVYELYLSECAQPQEGGQNSPDTD